MLNISAKLIQLSPKIRWSSTYAVENLLSKENISRTIAKFNGLKRIRLQTQEPIKKAAVFIPICVVQNRVSLLYTVKYSVLTQHKEKVNFPGDVQQVQDRSIVDTALRKTNDLVGISPSDIKVWGTGNLIVARSDYSFIPVIGEIRGQLNLEGLNLNEGVEEVFAISIQDLCNTKMNSYTQFKDEYSTPAFMGGKWRIWGFTAMLTNMFLKSLVPTSGYIHRVKYVPSIKKGTQFPRTSIKRR